jgi:hypothetical protein
MNEDINEICLDWQCVGTLADLNSNIISEKKGVYMFIYDNNNSPKRVIYVGTAVSGFTKRINTHIKLFENQKRTIWIVDEKEDVYDLMCFNRNYLEDEYNSKVKSETTFNVPDINFNVNNGDLIQNYKSNIKLWIANIEDKDLLFASKIESIIQKTLKDYFNIGYYTKKANQSWLGKELDNSKLDGIKLTFKTLPQVDSKTDLLFQSNFTLQQK